MFNISKGIASVCKQLHSLGINHGDLYAHNIMFDKDGNNLLGDFGAATFYDVNSDMAEPLQKIEVRAFGCLLDDMLMNTYENKLFPNIKLLEHLRDNCMQNDILKRPSFEEIVANINEL
jgi:serine/threonine protein kinase